jgi:hypothetical protein
MRRISKLTQLVERVMEEALPLHDTLDDVRETVHDEVEAWIREYQEDLDQGHPDP